jgi:excisionase family DNA binding protein
MQDEVTTDGHGQATARRAPAWRESAREASLRNALRKRDTGVPTLTVPEAAALLSVSQEHLYRLIQADGFPAVRLGMGGRRQGRYVVPTKAVDSLLTDAAASSSCVDAGEWTKQWQSARSEVLGEVA